MSLQLHVNFREGQCTGECRCLSVQSVALGMCVHVHGGAICEERTECGSRLESAWSCPGQGGSGHVTAGACRRQLRVVGMWPYVTAEGIESDTRHQQCWVVSK